MLLQGLFVPLTTPFYRDGVSYLRKLEHNVARYSLSPAAGLIALPPGGEASALTDVEAKESLQAVGETAAKEKVLIAGVEKASVHAAISLAKEAKHARFDAILLAPPTNWARLVRGEDARELLLFYEAVADGSPLPVILWSDAKPPYLPLPLSLVGTLARHPNVIGLLDADLTEDKLSTVAAETLSVRREVVVTSVFEAVTARMLEPVAQVAGGAQGFVAVDVLSSGVAVASPAPAIVASPAIKTRTKAVGFQVLSAGVAHDMVPLLRAGAVGASPTVAACAPQASFEAYAAWKDGDQPLADERAERLRTVEELIERLGPAAVKAGCDYNGYFGGLPRLPRLPLTVEDRIALERSLALIRN